MSANAERYNQDSGPTISYQLGVIAQAMLLDHIGDPALDVIQVLRQVVRSQTANYVSC